MKIDYAHWIRSILLTVGIFASVCIIPLVLEPLFRPPRQPSYLGTVDPPGEVEETLLIHANAPQEVLTARKYAGSVSIIITGSGQLDPNTGYDALFQYNYQFEIDHRFEDGRSRIHCCFGGLEIDGKVVKAWDFLTGTSFRINSGIPEYNPKHEYGFLYDVGSELRQISFRIQSDNSNSAAVFTVRVSIANIVYGPSGR